MSCKGFLMFVELAKHTTFTQKFESMKQRISYSVLAILILIILGSCSVDNDDFKFEYPKTFTLEETKSYTTGIRLPGSTIYDTILPPAFISFSNSINLWVEKIPFDEIELLSDTSARISGGELIADSIIICSRQDVSQAIIFNLKYEADSGQDSINMYIWKVGGNQTLSLPGYIYQHSYLPFQPPFQSLHSPISKYYASTLPDLVSFLALNSEYDNKRDTLVYKNISLSFR